MKSPWLVNQLAAALMLAGAVGLPAQNKPAQNPACQLLTAAEVNSAIGAVITSIPYSTAAATTCTMVSDNGTIAILRMDAKPEEMAAYWDSQLRIWAGREVTDLGVKAFVAQAGKQSMVGVVRNRTFVRVTAEIKNQTPEQVSTKIRNAMKSAAARL